MKRNPSKNRRILAALVGGALVFVMSAGLFVSAAVAQEGTPTPEPGTATEAAPTAPPKACAECHPNIQDSWTVSPHAHAFDDPEFTAHWESNGEPGECLVCHTTGYQANTGTYTAPGVTCEACHGQASTEHPPQSVPVLADTAYCGACHTTTLGEWRLTGHSAANVGCSDCHNPHSQKALFENPDEMCVNCHKDDIGEHKDDLHIEKGVTCVECHMLVLPPETPPTDGIVPTGHSFTITPATCVSCHTDTLHIGEPLPGYEAGAKAVSASGTLTSTLPTVIAEYTEDPTDHPEGMSPVQQIQALQATLASTRLSMLFQGGIIGLVLGGTTAFFLAANQRREEQEEAREEASADAEPDDEQA